MAPLFLLHLFLLLNQLALSTTTVANMAATPINTTNSTAVNTATDALNAPAPHNSAFIPISTEARFMCTYDGDITRVVLIDFNTHIFVGLQSQIARFFPDKPAEFAMSYRNLVQDDEHAPLVDINTDADVPELLLLYYRLVNFYPNTTPIALYLRGPPPPMWRGRWLVLGLSAALILILVGACLIVRKICRQD